MSRILEGGTAGTGTTAAAITALVVAGVDLLSRRGRNGGMLDIFGGGDEGDGRERRREVERVACLEAEVKANKQIAEMESRFADRLARSEDVINSLNAKISDMAMAARIKESEDKAAVMELKLDEKVGDLKAQVKTIQSFIQVTPSFNGTAVTLAAVA